MSQRYREHDTSTADVLSVTLDTGENPQPNVEIFMKSSGIASFDIASSSDNVNFRPCRTENVIGPSFEKCVGFDSAFRYIRVSTLAVQNNEIEIVATG